MKIARYYSDGRTYYGLIEGDSVKRVTGDVFKEFTLADEARPLESVKLLAPVVGSKVLAVGLNYASHLGNAKPPPEPGIFLKSPSALLDPDESIILPRDSEHVEPEGELVVVMGRTASDVSKDEALDYVLGYTCGNDVSGRPWQRGDLSWWRAKASDTFAPLGPCINTDTDPFNTDLEVRINGDVVQKSNTSDLIFDVPTIISFISRSMTLEPGDVIYTGTPGRPQKINPGDVVEVELSGIGVLRNPVASET